MPERVTSFAQIIEMARQRGPRTMSIAVPQDKDVLTAACEARDSGIANPILIGDSEQIKRLAAANNLDLQGMQMFNEPNPNQATRRAVEIVSRGEADMVMGGKVNVASVLHAALDSKIGLRVGRLLTHVAVFEIPGFDRLIWVADAGVVVDPDLEKKIQIVQNAIDVARRVGIDEPKVALIAALEMVNPAMPATVDAANLSKMAERGQIRGGLVDGPLGLDNAISPEAAKIKGIRSSVAGQADILIAPDIEAGNMLVMAISYLAGGRTAGVVVGGKAPIILASREDVPHSRLASVALGSLLV